MPKEIPGREVAETDLIPGIRYWAVSNTGLNRFSISSGIYTNKFVKDPNITMLNFVGARSITGIIDTYYENSFSFRYWYPLKSMMLYYEIRTLTEKETKEIIQVSRKVFERRTANILDTYTRFPTDLAKHIARFAISD